jgi:hypothetical protein
MAAASAPPLIELVLQHGNLLGSMGKREALQLALTLLRCSKEAAAAVRSVWVGALHARMPSTNARRGPVAAARMLAWMAKHARLLRSLEAGLDDGGCGLFEEESVSAGMQAAAGTWPSALKQKHGKPRAQLRASVAAATRATPCKAYVQDAAAAAKASPWTEARRGLLPLVEVKVTIQSHGFLLLG